MTLINDRKSEKKKHDMGFKYMFAGSIAGLTSKTILQPLDVVKVRLQVQDGRSANEYRGITHAIQSILRNEGFLALFSGLAPTLIASTIRNGVYFFSYNQLKDFFKRRQLVNLSYEEQEIEYKHVHLGPLTHLSCAGMSGAMTTFFTNPFSLIKTRLQLQGKEIQQQSRMYTGVTDAFNRIIREEGFFSLYRGLGASIILISNSALQFMSYEELKKLAIYYVDGEQNLTATHYFLMGGTAKIFSSTLTYPISVTKARLYALTPDYQLQMTQQVTDTNVKLIVDHKYKNMTDVFRCTWKDEGWRGFYRGLVPQLIKVVPSSAITFLIYETVLKFFNTSRTPDNILKTSNN